MPVPTYTQGGPASLVDGLSAGGKVSIPAAANYAVVMDLSAKWQGHVTCDTVTGAAVAGTSGLLFEALHVYGSSNLTGGPYSAAATTFNVASTAGMVRGQPVVFCQNAGLGSGGAKQGEVLVVNSVVNATQFTTTAGSQFAYAAGDTVYQAESGGANNRSGAVQPGPLSGVYAINSVYAVTMYLPQTKFILKVTNLDAANALSALASLDTLV